MNKLLKVYLKNIFSQKGFYICLAISFFMDVLVSFLVYKFTGSEAGNVSENLLSVFAEGVGIIKVIYITLFVCLDFTDGTTKNYIARGYTRRQLLFGKYLISLLAVGMFILVDVIGVFLFYSTNGFGFSVNDLIYIVGCIFTIIASVGLIVVISNTAEKLSTAMTINIILPTVIGLLSPLFTNVLKLGFDVTSYWVTNLTMLMDKKAPTIGDMGLVIVISLVYVVVLFELSNFIIKRKEVK